MPRKAQIYIGFVICLGSIVMLAAAASATRLPDPQRLLIYVGLTVVASLVKIRLPGASGCYSLNSVFLLAGVVYFTLPETVTAAVVAVVVQSFANAERRPAPVQLLFNIANESSSLALGFVSLHALVDWGLLPFQPVLMSVAAAIYFVVNTTVVSGILSILEGKSLAEVNRQWYYWSFPYYLLGAAAVGLLPIGGQNPVPQAWLLLVPLAYLVHFFYGLVGRKQEDNQSGAADRMTLGPAAKTYVGIVLVGAAVILVYALFDWPAVNIPRFTCLLALALLSAAWKVRLPGTTGTLSAHYVVVLVAITELSLGEALILGAVGPVAQTLWKPKTRPLPVQVMFNVGAHILSAAAAFSACRILLRSSSSDSLALLLGIAAAVSFAVNTTLVAAVVALVENRPVVRLWQQLCFWSFPSYPLGAAAACLMAVTSRSAGWGPSLLIMPLMVMAHYSYKMHLREKTAL